MWVFIGLMSLCGTAGAAAPEPLPDAPEIPEEAVVVQERDAPVDAPPVATAVSVSEEVEASVVTGEVAGEDTDPAADAAAPSGKEDELAGGVASPAGDGDELAAETTGAPGEDASPADTMAAAPVRIEDALEEQATPLDSVAFSIEQGELEGTEAFLEHYVRAIESAHHRYHPDLVRPLTLLGDAQSARQRFDLALDAYGRALHIRRVSDGLFAPDQVEVVYRQAAALQAIGNVEEAANREEYAYSVLLKAHGLLSEELLTGTYRLAEWYRESYNIFAARALYERAMRIHEANGKQSSLSALPALKGLVFTYRQERFPPKYVSDNQSSAFGAAPLPMSTRATVYSGQITINNFPAAERALQHIVRIRREDPQSEPLEVYEAILDLADWHLMWEHFRKAQTLYEFVYAQMDQLDTVDASAYFAEPRVLYVPLPEDPRAPRGSESATERVRQTGFIEAAFRVSANGSVQDVEIVASEPEGLMDFRSRRSLRSSRYRPAMANGKAVPFDNQTWRHEFRYVPSDDAEVDDA